jgi:hypothetical protein
MGGSYPTRWNQLRSFGPTKSRFDQHTLPARNQRRSIAYLTSGDDAFTTAIAEYFQDESGAGVGPIDVNLDQPTASMWLTATPLLLLDLASGWMTRAGGNQAICSGPRSVSREWARAIYATYGKKGRTPFIVGLAYRSSIWGPGTCLCLWETGQGAFPDAPAATRALADPVMARAVAKAADTLRTLAL